MKVMLLAAGRGERMRPITDRTPKPLLQVAGKPLIVHTIEALAKAGFQEFIINIAHLGKQIEAALGNGECFNVHIRYSQEGDESLETAGGILHALPLLGNKPFLVVNGDIASNYPYAGLRSTAIDLAHLVMVKNPAHHAGGDFGITEGYLQEHATVKYTYSGIGIYHPALFANIPQGKSKLAPLLRVAMRHQHVTGELHDGFWMDIGTPERLKELEQYYYQRGSYYD